MDNMVTCQNCGESVLEGTRVCPTCGEFIREESEVADSNGLLQERSPEEEYLNGPGKQNKFEDLPEEQYPEDELKKKEKEEKSDFGRSEE